MSICLWLVFDDPVITRLRSETLARASNVARLDEIAVAQDAVCLENFCSPTVLEICRSLVGEEEPGPLKWFEPRDALQTVVAILRYGDSHPGALRGIVRDLRTFERALEEAVRKKVRFRLQLDYRGVLPEEE